MTLQLADRTYRHQAGILVVPVIVGNFAFPVDFVDLEMEDKSVYYFGETLEPYKFR
jgi:hypothetical protein